MKRIWMVYFILMLGLCITGCSEEEKGEIIYKTEECAVEEMARVQKMQYKDGKIYILGKTKNCYAVWKISENGKLEKRVDFDIDLGMELLQFCVEDDNFIFLMETSKVQEDGSTEKCYFREVYQSQGELLEKAGIETEQKKVKYYNNFFLTGSFCCLISEKQMDIYGADGKLESRIELTGYVNVITADNEEKIYCILQKGAKKELIKIDTDTWEEITGNDMVLSNIGNKITVTKEGEEIFYGNTTAVYKQCAGEENQEKILEWYDQGINGSDVQDFTVTENGIIFAVVIQTTTGEIKLLKMSPVESNSVGEKKELTLAVFHLEDYLWVFQEQILKFNQEHTDIKITVKDYGESINGIEQLNLDIISGKAPDIINIRMLKSYQSYINKGIFTDLTPYLEDGKGIEKEDIMEKILELSEMNGSLYYMPLMFGIDCLAGEKSLLLNREKLTIDDLEELREQLPKDKKLFYLGETRSGVVRNFCRAEMENYVDWKKKNVFFHNGGFEKLLILINAEKEEEKSFYGNAPDLDRQSSDIIDGNSLLYFLTIRNADMAAFSAFYRAYGKDGYTLIGYPSESGSGISLNCTNTLGVYGITEMCEEKEAAWEFIESFLESQMEGEWSLEFPVVKEGFEKYMQKGREQHELQKKFGTQKKQLTEDRKLELVPWTENDFEMVEELIDKADTMQIMQDDTILNIIDEEVSAYFNGDKTAEETVELIQNRVEIYVKESD